MHARISTVVAAFLIAVPLSAGNTIPLKDWAVPSPAHGLRLQADTAGNPAAFNKMLPCRVYDSRTASGGPGPIPGSTSRSIPFLTSPCSGIPAGASAFSVNLTVTGSTAGAGYAFITAFPTGSARPGTASLNFLTGTQVGNAAIVPAGTAGAIDIYASATTEVIVDINGYFTNTADTGYQFQMTANIGNGAAIEGVNTAAVDGARGVGGFEGAAAIVHGVQGRIGSGTLAGSSGVHGIDDSAAGTTFGVFGQVTATAGMSNSAGVRGENLSTNGFGIGGSFTQNGSGGGVRAGVAGNGWGVNAYASGGRAINASETIGTAVYATQSSSDAPAGTSAIYGETAAVNPNPTYGVTGVSNAGASNSAGVRGIEATGPPAYLGATLFFTSTGVIGLSKQDPGVTGASEVTGVLGARAAADGTGLVTGVLGEIAGPNLYGVFANGDLGATGTKAFVEPHPTDASQVIRYVALEGREAGTYFRGRGKFVNHHATIAVPDDFRDVTDEEGLTVNITPIGGIASVGVMTLNLNRIEVESTKDVEFSYLVQGVRKAYKEWSPVGPGGEFVPASPDARLPDSLSAEAKRRLIANGTYNADGTVNRETAERLGWAKQWQERNAAVAKRAEEVNRRLAAEHQQTRAQQ